MRRSIIASVIAGVCFSLAGTGHAQEAAAAHPVILELFTSQGCSSCPSADALLGRLSARDPLLLALSYHVDYWDRLGWKDPHSSPANTQRQNAYAQALGLSNVFTPQLIVNGAESLVGSQERAVTEAIGKAKRDALPWTVSITPQSGKLAVSAASPSKPGAEWWEVRFDRGAKTQVTAGENGGRMLESIHNVTRIRRLAQPTPSSPVMIDPVQEGGVAILAQAPGQGRMLGAAFYRAPDL